MEIINLLQSASNQTIVSFFKFITLLGNEEFYLLVLPILLWNWKKDNTKRLFILFLSGMLLAVVLKGIFQVPRPQDVALIEVDGASFPSGHAVGAVIFWGFLAWSIKKSWFTIFSLIIIALISLSRIVLGVHWPFDVFGGAAIGAAVLAIGRLFNKIDKRLKPSIWILLLFVISIFVSVIIPTDDVSTVAGLLLGVGTGLMIENAYIDMQKTNLLWKNIVGTILGCVIVILLWAGLKKIFPSTLPFRFARYCIIGSWISLGAPYFLTLTGLYLKSGHAFAECERESGEG